MELYEEVIIEKRKRYIRKAAVFCGILAIGVTVYFFVFGAGNGFLKNSSAIALRSFKDAFGFSLQGNSMEIAIGNTSMAQSSSAISVADSTNGTVVTDTAKNISGSASENGSITMVKKSGAQESSNGNVAGPEMDSPSDVSSGTASSVGDNAVEESPGMSEIVASSSTDVSAIASGTASSSSLVIASSSAKKKSFSKNIAAKRCAFPAANIITPPHQIILNEIAWMGSPAKNGESATAASNNEWMEIKNEAPDVISLAGWELIDTAKNIAVVFDDSDIIAPFSLYLLERTDDDSVPNIAADKIYSGSLPNTGDAMGIFDGDCALVDFLDAKDGWPGGDNGTKRTLERDLAGFGWHTSADPGGTPKAGNSGGFITATITSDATSTVLENASSSITTSSSVAVIPKYMVSIALAGDGAGKVTSNPAGINCGSDCEKAYSVGQTITLHAVPGANAVFFGWAGPCSGRSNCVFTMTGYVSVTALFHGTGFALMTSPVDSTVDDFSDAVSAANASSSDAENISSTSSDNGTSQTSSTQAAVFDTDSNSSPASSTSATVSSTASSSVPTHLVIAAIQIAGASSTNDSVKIYNPTGASVDISGWKLRKKSATGADYSLREMPSGSSVPARGIFTWANSAGGFSASIGADISSTETLSPDNSAAFFDAKGALIDAVAWGTGTNQYVERAAYPKNPAANQMLVRIFQNGAIVDTDNNASDFTVQ